MDPLRDLLGSDSEACDNGNQVIEIKAEDVIDTEVDEDCVLIPCPVKEAEQQVCLCIHCCTHFINTQTHCCLSYLCLSIHMKQFRTGEWILKSPFPNTSSGLYFVANCL
jgi:hypothetical protein